MSVINKRKRGKMNTGVILTGVLLLVYIPSFINWVYSMDIIVDMIRIGTVEDYINTEGYIVRDERVFDSPFDGLYIPEAAEGERVPVNYKIAAVIKESVIKLKDELSVKDKRVIEELSKRSRNQNIFSQDINKIEDDIKYKIKLLIREINANTLSNVSLLKAEINDLILKKSQIISGIVSSDNYMDDLIEEKDELQKQIDLDEKYIISEHSGFVSYVIDDYEDQLSFDSIGKRNADFFEDIDTSGGTISYETQAGKPFVKIIKGTEYDIAVVLDKNIGEQFKINDSVKLRINNINKEISGFVSFTSEQKDGRYIVSVRVDRCIGETSTYRRVNIDLIKESYEGLRVPLNSLTDVDLNNMKAKIVLVKANYASIREIKMLYVDGKYAIIGNPDGHYKGGVSLYDLYVVNAENIEEGQMIGK